MLSVQFSRTVVSDFLWPHGLQHTRLPCPLLSPKVAQTQVHWVGDAIQTFSSSVTPFSSCPPSFSASGLFQWVSSLHQMAKALGFQLHHQLFQWIFRVDFLYNWLVWFPCRVRDSQESSLAPQFESINSALLSLLYGPCYTAQPKLMTLYVCLQDRRREFRNYS